MVKKNILIGNGVNIEFDKNKDYSNSSILKRLIKMLWQNINNDDIYIKIFKGEASSYNIYKIITELNKFFNKYMLSRDKTIIHSLKTSADYEMFKDIIHRYKSPPIRVTDIWMEDYFFILRTFNNLYKDNSVSEKYLFDGIKMVFLDSIYNCGKINDLFENMNCWKPYLVEYDNVFTINYDTNIDKLLNKEIYHLHGRFDVLDDTYRTDTILGQINFKKTNPSYVTKGMEHIACNAIMGYCGKNKTEYMERYININHGLEDIFSTQSIDEIGKLITKLNHSESEEDKFAASLLTEKVNNPKLKCTEYPFKEFKNISGELHIIGVSPNNDNHIFSFINHNSKIDKVIYYFFSSKDKKNAKKVIEKPLETIEVSKYWKKVRQ